MKYLIFCLLLVTSNSFATRVTKPTHITINPAASSTCPVTVGTLTLNPSVSRPSGISPLLVWFDATNTTDSSIAGTTTVFKDVAYSWNFGDAGTSGTATWANGSRPGMSRNVAIGGVGAHLYRTQGSDTTYTATLTAINPSGTTASCTIAVTAFDPVGSNGYVGTNTVCAFNSTLGTGCPAGAATVTTSNFNTALASLGNGKQVLFKCGDTFTGDNYAITATGATIGAYGTCVGTKSSRPILSDAVGGNQILHPGGTTTEIGDLRITDLDLRATAGARGIWSDNFPRIHYQVTMNNLTTSGTANSYGFSQGAQMGLVDSVQNGETGIGTYFSFNENNPPYSGHIVNNQNYYALLGNLINGVGAPNGQGIEVVRISACRMCAINNNTFENANNVGAVLKLHEGNTNNSCAGNANGGCFPCTIGPQFATTTCWVGVYSELIVESYNLFTGTSGANLVENAPQNANTDERLRNIVMEGNFFSASTGAQGGRLLQVSAVNVAIRDNVFYMPGTPTQYPFYGAQMGARAMEPVASALGFYNNTCYAPNAISGQNCGGFDATAGLSAPAINSIARNNMFFNTAGGPTFVNNGTGNTVSNNTVSSSSNPVFTNGSGTFSLLTDFKPTASFTGGVAVPVRTDALGVVWTPTWDLGAEHH